VKKLQEIVPKSLLNTHLPIIPFTHLLDYTGFKLPNLGLTMKIKQRLVIIGIISYFLVGITPVLGNSEEFVDEVIASVNGKIITEKELENEIFFTKSEWGLKNKKNLRKIVLEQMIEENLLLQEAKKEGLIVTSEMGEKIFSDFKRRSSKEEFEELKKRISTDEIKRILEDKILSSGVLSRQRKEIEKNIDVKEEDIQNFYFKLKQYLQGEGDKEGIEDFYQEYREKLEKTEKVKIVQIIAKNETQLKSILSSLGEEGVWFNLREIKPHLRKELLSLKNGGIKIIKEGGDFYRIIQLKGTKKILFVEWRERIEEYLKRERAEEYLKKWLEEIKSKAEIRIITK